MLLSTSKMQSNTDSNICSENSVNEASVGRNTVTFFFVSMSSSPLCLADLMNSLAPSFSDVSIIGSKFILSHGLLISASDRLP